MFEKKIIFIPALSKIDNFIVLNLNILGNKKILKNKKFWNKIKIISLLNIITSSMIFYDFF